MSATNECRNGHRLNVETGDCETNIYMEPANNYNNNQHSDAHFSLSPNASSNLVSYLNSSQHAPSNESSDTQCHNCHQSNETIANPEFLPLCDLLFNILSIAAYFCDVVFDCVTIYILYIQQDFLWFLVSFTFVIFSGVVSQILSLLWYFKSSGKTTKLKWTRASNICIIITHLLQCGILWRYFKLFIPVDLSSVKHEVRDLCLLRMIHAFCEAAPMLLIQVYLIWCKPTANEVTDLNVISAFLSLFSLCWALASFSKNVRRKNMHKLVLTWLGVIFQFLWRLGTVSSRIFALTVYATVYNHWVFIVIFLHWFSVNAYIWYNQLVVSIVWGGFVLGIVFMVVYYKFFHIRHLKHVLLATNYDALDFPTHAISEHSSRQFNGVSLNFRNSNLNRETKYELTNLNSAPNCMITGIPGVFNCRINPALKRKKKKPSTFVPPPTHSSIPVSSHMVSPVSTSNTSPFSNVYNNRNVTKSPCSNQPHSTNHLSNPLSKPESCRYSVNIGNSNPSVPPSVIRMNTTSPLPVSTPSRMASPPITSISSNLNIPNCNRVTSPINVSDQDGSVGSRVNIQQKLQEKKQQQLLQLREIEEEIKQGKLKPHPLCGIVPPPFVPESYPPQSKEQPWFSNKRGVGNRPFSRKNGVLPHYYYYHPAFRRLKLRSQTPEVLLVPHYLDKSRVYYDYPSCVLPPSVFSRLPQIPVERSSEEEGNYADPIAENLIHENAKNNVRQQMPKETKVSNLVHRMTSDIESQVSLPRSYTLPREFRYYRGNATVVGGRGKYRKPVRSEHFNGDNCNNSSDGDVDSDFNNDDEGETTGVPQIIRGRTNFVTSALPLRKRMYMNHNRHKRHETPS
ncbi:XK-related protein 4-like protein [Dinothrombium tinctorium]|uniref:XK-related protein n=1 Tax=Dinothrombium tinctorium TaxID=1965070 RepID=A0A443RR73_9ACAR|nr:XK-related protein 4-like protein [Dinothrombium tinctorium]